MAKRRRRKRAKTGTADRLRSELQFHGADSLVVKGKPFGRGWVVFAGERELAELRQRKVYGRDVFHVTVGNLTVSAGSLAEAAEVVVGESERA